MAYVRITDEEPEADSSVTRRNESLERRERKSSHMNVWTIVGGLALVAAAAAVIVSLPDIKRYIKISTM